jgi:hypothetical protein
MNIKEIVRNSEYVRAHLHELADDKLVTSKDCAIYIPVRFSECGMASVSVETNIVGIYLLVMEGKYSAISLVNTTLRITPQSTNRVVINGDEYYEFVFPAGSTVIPNMNVVQNNKIPYRVYSEFFAKGRIPFYLNYEDLAKIFDTAKKFGGVNIGSEREVTELLVSIISRDSKNRSGYYRQTVETADDVKNKKPAFIPLKSVAYSATNTTNKLAGSYMQDGIVSALVSPSERVERIEGLLR